MPNRRLAEDNIAGPGVVSETASRVLYAAGGVLLLLFMLFGAAYRGARALRLPRA
ncbi:MAG: hypothetical protein H7233_10735 [Pseudorhodobacter sp.]|nr:hypothetical protein [Frankiaceae bacterium]